MAKLIEITGKAISGEWGNDDLTGEGIPVLRTTNFTNEGLVNYANVVTRDLGKKDISKKYLQPGDIIIEKSGGSDNQPVGRVIYFDGPESTYLFNNFTGLLRVNDTQTWISRYVFYALFANYQFGGTRCYENRTTGLHNLKTDAYVSSVEIKDLSFKEQRKIVETLDNLTGLISLRKQQLAKLDELVKARFVEMFGDEKQFTDMPLSESVEEMFIGPFGSSLKNDCFVSKEDAFCMVYEQKHAIKKTMDVETRYVGQKKYNELKRFTVMGGDIIVSCRGTIGEIYILPDDAPLGIMHPSIMKIRLKESVYNKNYFVFALEQSMKKHHDEANGSGVKMAVTATTLGKERFAIPPMPSQQQFANFVVRTNRQKLTIQQSLDKLEVLRKSLMQEYFG